MENARFLGVYIDEKLQWNEHINQISAKVSKNIGILKNKSAAKYICVVIIV